MQGETTHFWVFPDGDPELCEVDHLGVQSSLGQTRYLKIHNPERPVYERRLAAVNRTEGGEGNGFKPEIPSDYLLLLRRQRLGPEGPSFPLRSLLPPAWQDPR